MLFLIHIFNLISFALGSYSINVFPEPLDKDLEEKLIYEAKEGNKDARAQLIEHNLRLVAHIVKKFEHFDKDTDDLISIGTIGLIKGIDTFKPDKKNKLTTYTARCIENEILMHFRQTKKTRKNVSLNDLIGYDKDGNEINLIDVIKDEDVDYIGDIHKKENISLLKDAINVLNDKEKEIIIKRYGLNNKKCQTQKEIAKEMNISRSYVSRIEKRALSKIYLEFKHKKMEF